jgi:hypothetical protein
MVTTVTENKVTEVITPVKMVYVKGEGYNRPFTFEELVNEFQDAFGDVEWNSVLEFAQKSGFVVVEGIAYAYYIKYRAQRTYNGDIHPVELSFQTRNRFGNLITKCLYGKLVVENDPGLLDGVYDGGDEVVADISTPEKEALFNLLEDCEIIGYAYTTFGNYHYPVFKGDVTTLILPGGFRMGYREEENLW